MCGCCSAAVVVISCTKRSAPNTAASSGLSTLSATFRLCLRSSARYTVAMPPAPSSRSMRYRSWRADVRAGGTAATIYSRLLVRMRHLRRRLVERVRRLRTLDRRIGRCVDAFRVRLPQPDVQVVVVQAFGHERLVPFHRPLQLLVEDRRPPTPGQI